jgi:Mg-chelatase subunit ChlD
MAVPDHRPSSGNNNFLCPAPNYRAGLLVSKGGGPRTTGTRGEMTMTRSLRALALPAALLGLCVAFPAASPAAGKDKKAPRPKIEVVFCLDTTGSMGGLIEGAKAKVWAICNQIANGKPTPDLKVGLVAYRDRGDNYITKVTDLTDDLDAVHGELKGFSAQGGGDAPESVNQALDDAVNKVKWSTDKKTLRIIFLVGDAPPHMDYPDDVKYPITCKKACEKAIIINTIQCGGDGECARHWKEIAAKAEGSYAAIPQAGGVVAIATPYDKELADINRELARSTVVFGKDEEREMGEARAGGGGALPAPAAADRVALGAKIGRVATYDLLDAVKAGRVKLDEIKPEELPPELRKMTPKERKEHLEKLDRKRAELNKKVLDLDRKRGEYVRKEMEKKGKSAKDSFDEQVLDMLRKQARRIDVTY